MRCDFDVPNKVMLITKDKTDRGDLTLYIAEQVPHFADMKGVILLLKLPDMDCNKEEAIIKLIYQDFSKIVGAIGFKFESSGVFYTFHGTSKKSIEKALQKYPEFKVLLNNI